MVKKALTVGKDSFTTKDICRIIDMCSKAGVSKLKFGDLEVEFHSEKMERPLHQFNTGTDEIRAYQNDTQIVLPVSKAQSVNLHAPATRELLSEMEQSQLMIDDPLAYEQMVVDKHLGFASATGVNGNRQFDL